MKLIICGDMSVADESVGYFEKGDYKAAFGDITDVFHKADRSIVNLECAITESEKEIKKYGPCLKGPMNTAKALKDAGVTDCMLSNNHIFDYGVKGLKDTIVALNDNGIEWTGVGKNYEDSRQNHIIKKDGLTISIINVCEHEYSYATQIRCGARPFDEFETMHDIRETKKCADYVIVIYHGGKEFCRYPSPRLVKACREMVRCGADAVFCQHSHCIGCYEVFEGATILYGQGNFHFAMGGKDASWYEGLVLELNITKENFNVKFIPVICENGTLRVCDAKTSKEILDSFSERSKELKNGKWKERWHEYCVSVHDIYKRAFCNHKIEDDENETQVFSHYVDCEAHTDVWKELFPTWNATNELDVEFF